MTEKKIHFDLSRPKNILTLTAQEIIEYCKTTISKKPKSHKLYLEIIPLIVENPVVLFGGPLGGGDRVAEQGYVKIHNIHAEAGCDSKTDKCKKL